MKFKKQRSFIVNSSSARLYEPTPKADRIAELRAKLNKVKPSNVGHNFHTHSPETMYKKEPTLIYDSGWIDAK